MSLGAFFKDIKHIGKLGPGFLMRHPLALMGQKEAAFEVKDVGRVHLRYGQTDDAVLRQVFSRREYDLSKYPQRKRLEAAYEALVAAGKRPLIIDAGANIGMASIWFAQRFPKALVLAVEPDPGNLDLCRKNLAPFANVKLIEGAIGARSGRVGLQNHPKGRADGVRTVRDDAGGVRIFSVADLQAEAGDASLFLVKVDIEGFESDLFSENVDWLDQCAGVIVEPHDWMLPGQHSSRSLQRALFTRDFEMLIHRESLVFIR